MPDLLMTKLFIPRRRHDSVLRPRLFDRLNVECERKITIITAPAGFGKTTLLSEWILQSDRNVTWLSLDEKDNDPARFWAYFIAALQRLSPDMGKDALALLHSPQPSPIEEILTILLNEIAGFPDCFIQVLDDYQVIHTPSIHAALYFFLENMPLHMHLVVSSRTDPPLPLGRLRASDQLNELRMDDLRFTPDESAVFLNQSLGLNLSMEEVLTLESHTEGWIAGLQLAGLALQGSGKQLESDYVSRFIQAFSGSNRYVVSYLVEEVLNQRPEGTMDFLLKTSILDHLSGPLCDHLIDVQAVENGSNGGVDHNSQSILERLVQANLFIAPLDDEGKWFRYHQLFTDVLRARLKHDQPGISRKLHLRASEWHEQSGMIPEAIMHALEAEDWDRAARLIEQIVEAVALTGQVQTVLNWLNMLPEIVVRAHPTLCLYNATMLMFTNKLDESEVWLQNAERCVHPGMPSNQVGSILGWVALIRADISRTTGDLSSGVAQALRALELLPENETLARSVSTMNLVHGWLATGYVSQTIEFEAAEAIFPVRKIGNRLATLISITNLARLQTLQGKLHQAADTYALLEQEVSAGGRMHEMLNSASYFFGLGDVLREWNQLETAQQYLAYGMELVQGRLSVDADVVMAGYLAMAKLKQEQGDPAGGIRVLDEFVQLANEREYFEPLVARSKAIQAQILLRKGNSSAAIRWMEESRLDITDLDISYLHEAEYFTIALVMIARARTHEALRLLERLLELAEIGERKDSMIKILAIQALAFYTNNELPRALTVLGRALSLAEPESYMRVFIDEGEPMRSMITDLRSRITDRSNKSLLLLSYVDQLLAGFPNRNPGEITPKNHPYGNEEIPEHLSNRELAVLHLIASGASNAEIAQTLIIALSTVKRHTGNLYGKLGVRSRTQAIARAKELGLVT